VSACGTIYLHEIPRPEILDAGRIERNHLRAHILCLFGRRTARVEPGVDMAARGGFAHSVRARAIFTRKVHSEIKYSIIMRYGFMLCRSTRLVCCGSLLFMCL
jgi:hypothetical protein